MSLTISDWLIFAFPIIVFSGLLAAKVYRFYRLSRAGIFTIDKMSGVDFEKRLGVMFKKLGYRVQYPGSRQGGDYGVDLIIEKNGRKTAVQAKRYRRQVGEDAVREVVAGKNVYHCQHAMVVTNSRFTPMARHLAAANQVTLYPRYKLIDLLLKEK
jgi:restriction system protein